MLKTGNGLAHFSIYGFYIDFFNVLCYNTARVGSNLRSVSRTSSEVYVAATKKLLGRNKIMFENFKRLVKASQITEETAAAAEEARKDTAPQQPQVRPGSAAHPATRPARPAAVRPAAKDASYDDFLEKEVGEKLAREKAESERLDEAISENEEQLKLLLGNLTEEEAKDPGVQKLLERLGNDGAKLKKQRSENAAPLPKKAEPKTKKAEPKKTESKDKEPDGEAKDETKTKAEEAKAPSQKVPAICGAWASKGKAVVVPPKDGKSQFNGAAKVMIIADQVKSDQANFGYHHAEAAVGPSGKVEILPVGESIYNLADFVAAMDPAEVPKLPTSAQVLRELAAAGICQVKEIAGRERYFDVPVMCYTEGSSFPGKEKFKVLGPYVVELGISTINAIKGPGCKVDQLDYVVVEGNTIVKAVRDGENVTDGFC